MSQQIPQFCFRVSWLREPDAPRLGLNFDRRNQGSDSKTQNARRFIAELLRLDRYEGCCEIKATLSLIPSAGGLCEVRHAVWVMKSRAAKCAVNRLTPRAD